MLRLKATVAFSGALALVLLALPGVQAQQYGKTNDPNLGHFYMARQQIQILDDAPAVNDLRTQPVPPGQQNQAGAMMNRPVPLPRAGWQGYASSIPSMSNSLPKTFNGVPPKGPPPMPPGVSPKMGKAGAYKAGSKKGSAVPGAGAPTSPATAKTYAPFEGYGGAAPAARTTTASGGSSSSTHVQGSLLHWSRTRPN